MARIACLMHEVVLSTAALVEACVIVSAQCHSYSQLLLAQVQEESGVVTPVAEPPLRQYLSISPLDLCRPSRCCHCFCCLYG